MFNILRKLLSALSQESHEDVETVTSDGQLTATSQQIDRPGGRWAQKDNKSAKRNRSGGEAKNVDFQSTKKKKLVQEKSVSESDGESDTDATTSTSSCEAKDNALPKLPPIPRTGVYASLKLCKQWLRP